MRINAFIPARGGSTGVPRKNIRMLDGIPLISHSIEFARSLTTISKIIVSTDSSQIATIASQNVLSEIDFEKLREDSLIGIDERLILHKRPSIQAQTLSPIRDVLFDLCQAREDLDEFDYLCMLQPTSPFRTTSEMSEITRLMKTNYEWTSIASFTEVSGMHPDRMYRRENQVYVTPYINQRNLDNKPRQLLDPLIIKDGAYYVFKTEKLKERVMLGDKILPFLRKGLRTLNIDTETDFEVAELIANYSSWRK